MAQRNPDCQKLLHGLKVTAEGLLVNQVSNVWNVYGGLNRLHSAVEKIFKHGCKLNDKGSPDIVTFFRSLTTQEEPSVSHVDISKQENNVPMNIRHDPFLTWVYKTLQEHLLSRRLHSLLSSPEHLVAFYQENSFLRQFEYAEAAVLCLKAVERKQPNLLTEINPSLYVVDSENVKNKQKGHKRCVSLPQGKCDFIKNLSAKTLPDKNDITGFGKSNSARDEQTPDEPDKNMKIYSSLPNLTQVVMGKEQSSSCSEVLLTADLQQGTPAQVVCAGDGREQLGCDISFAHAVDLSDHVRKKSCFHQNEGREWFVVQGRKEATRKTFMQDGGTSVLPMATGYFPRPVQGQSLTSFLSSEHFSRKVAELDRENAHFSISEAMISAIEQMKCNRQLRLAEDVNDEDSDEEINQLKQRIRLRRRQRLEEKHLRHLWSNSLLSDGKTDTTTDQSVSPLSTSPETPSESLSTDDVEDFEVDEANNLKDLKNSGLSVSMGSLYSEADVSKAKKEGGEFAANAENVALSLLKQFKKKQLPKASDLEWLVSEEDAPQELLPLPKSWPVSPDDAERMGAPFLRGTTDWAPPRPQVIFTQHPPPARRSLLSKQHFRCAGCGLRVAPEYSHKFRYCEYLGRYFCTGCHSNQLSVIPGHIIFKWNFKRYPVSTFSYRLIDQMSTDPLFPLKDINPCLYKKVRDLDRARRLRMQLFYLKDFMFSCRFALELKEDLEKEPCHMFQDPEMYSLQDLIQTRSGELLLRLKDLVKDCLNHVNGCQLCSARGFICELCPAKEAIYPWCIDRVSKCSHCGACYHLQCFKSGFCPRCARASARRRSALDSDF